MKKILFSFYLLSIFLTGFSQIQRSAFKNVQRQAIDTLGKNFIPVMINGNSKISKSANSAQLKNSLISTFATKDTSIKIKYSQTSKLPVFIEREAPKTKSSMSNEVRCFDFLESVKNYMGISNPKSDFYITDIKSDKLGQTHIRLFQKYNGIDVYGSDLYVHLKDNVEQFTGKFQVISNQPNLISYISEGQALKIANNDLKTKSTIKELTLKEKSFLNYDKPQIRLVIKDVEGKLKTYKLMYLITIRANFIQEWIYFIDAENGTIFKSYDNTKYDGPVTASAYDLNNVLRNINTYFESGAYYLKNGGETMYNSIKNEGYIITLDAQNSSGNNINYITSTNNVWNNKSAISAHYNSALTFQYFKNTFGRNSINNLGGNMMSIVNFVSDSADAGNCAFWNGSAAFFGAGGSLFYNLAEGLDAVSHEFGHGVVQNTANLIYQDQSGAINETYADIFATMVDRDEWYIGDEITKTTFSPTSRLRDMSNPHNSGTKGDRYWQPMHTSEMYIGPLDYGGVHSNSGICNYAYYKYAIAITKEKAEQIFYRALENYLTSSSQFLDLRIAIVQSATDLYGATSIEVIKAKEVFEAVGIYEDAGNNYVQDYVQNPGVLNLCYYDLEAAHPYSFYSSSIIGQNPVGLTTTLANSKMSFTDDGAYAVYVSSVGTLRAIDMSTKNDVSLQNDPVWSNIAISKDGNKFAAISKSQDTAIYVYDFNLAKWAKFHLYNPTTNNGSATDGGVLYSDAIEFDITGENIIYDAYNVIKTTTGSSIYYWDIGLINVWDSQKNNFADGTITKLYGSLPENVNIGDPTFSKNSPYIIAFDYFNESSSTYAILGVNLLTGESDIISNNTTLGYPSYSKNDNILVFTSTNGSFETVKGIELKANKISPNGSSVQIINNARWGVCYATGTRALGLSPISNFTVDYKNGNSPMDVQFFDLSINNPDSWLWTFIGGIPSSSTEQNPNVTYNSSGTYSVSLKTTNSFGNNSITKTNYIQVLLATEINDSKKSEITFYPNPVSTTLNIKSEIEFSTKIYNIQGDLILKCENQTVIDLSNLQKGFYLIEIKTKHNTIREKLIKN